MNGLQSALFLADRGFYVFPVAVGKKSPPQVADFSNLSQRQKAIIENWWHARPNWNIGIATSRFEESNALLVVDVDTTEFGTDSLPHLAL